MKYAEIIPIKKRGDEKMEHMDPTHFPQFFYLAHAFTLLDNKFKLKH